MNIDIALSAQTMDTIVYVLAFVLVLHAGTQVMKYTLKFYEQLDEKYKDK